MKLTPATAPRVILTFALAIAPLVSKADNPSVKNYNVSGVQLGMSVNESIDALVAHYSINRDEFEMNTTAKILQYL